MSSALKNLAVIAAAGSRKTSDIIDAAMACTDGRVLITTFTDENQRQIIRRIEQLAGVVPSHITVMGWFTFLICQCSKPYQRVKTGEPLRISGLNFIGQKHKYAKKASLSYYLDSNSDMFRDGVSDFVVALNDETNGAVFSRLEKIYKHIFVDEVQDLVGYDLDVLDLLMRSSVRLTFVGDPRQHTFSTNSGPRNKKYRGVGFLEWVNERSAICQRETRECSYRCNQLICDFADAIYPAMPKTKSVGVDATGHDGVFLIPAGEAAAYAKKYHPTVLRYDKRANTAGLPAMNIGVSKGSTFDRVLIFPTQPMLKYLKNKDADKLTSREKLYVAVTRARYSVAFAVPGDW
jgi:DNA helicase II / ATP-dependent DNA helicase PcrA